MRIGTLLLAAVASATLVGCAPMYIRNHPNPFVSSVQCTTQDCSLQVAVVGEGDSCIPDVVHVLDVSSGVAGPRDVTWTITTPGYEFSRESYKYGIFIKSDPDEEFRNVQITGGGKSLNLKFQHQATGKKYSYALTVRRTGGDKGFCRTLDPWLIS